MPRRARISVPGVAWHVVQRGHNRSTCFFDRQDRQYYMEQLQIHAAAYDCAVHAYCLMTNHIHLLITPASADCASNLMKRLGQNYTQYVNRRYQRSGSMWEGRFKSCIAQDEGYALNCYRYIELNPVRSGLVQNPGDYAWSSFACNALGRDEVLISPHSSYLGLGATRSSRAQAYRAQVACGLDKDVSTRIRAATDGNYVFGNNDFQQEVESTLGRRVTPARAGRPANARKWG